MASEPTPDLETVVVGGGAVGLAVARSLALAGEEVVLLERHAILGSEISSRNSEVIHAGLYYPPGSLKARLCVEGKRLLYRLLADHGVPHRRLGKLLVATHERQLPDLAKYKATALRNGVDDLNDLTAAEAKALEPAINCVAGLLSPSTGILDSHAYMLALAGEFEAQRGTIVLNTPVSRIGRARGSFELVIGGDAKSAVTCRRLVLAAGLHATELARTLAFQDGYSPPTTYLARGRYYALRGRAPFQRLIYPMPVPGGLGIHVTLDMGGRAKFGPDVQWIEAIDYGFDTSAEAPFHAAIRDYWPGLPEGALQADGTGIRPKLSREGEPAADFAIHGPAEHGLDGLVLLFGIESPGLTSSLAIAEHVRRLLQGST